MSLESQAILPGHMTAEGVAGLLREKCDVTQLGIRDMHRKEYKLIEFVDSAGDLQVLNVFLESYAAADYASVYSGESTLITAQFSPSNCEVLVALVGAMGGCVQTITGAEWKHMQH